MNNKIWIMEGLSSQKDIIQGIHAFAEKYKTPVTVYASHRNERHEILSAANYSFIEPGDTKKRLPFILDIVAKYSIAAIHAGRNTLWYEEHRPAIEKSGVKLTSGAAGSDSLKLADDKVTFAEFMQQHDLPVVPSWRIERLSELRAHIDSPPFNDSPLCVKPVTGIYGMGFWRFDPDATAMSVFNHPESRVVHPDHYLAAIAACETFSPLVLMPYLPGPEYSVDILADNGEILAAVGRRKEGAIQYLENSGAAFELACACARALKVDGLVNVQTRHNHRGEPMLLEANMRPSGGIGYTRQSGVNLPGLFAFYQLGLMSKDDVIDHAKTTFTPAAVRPITDAARYPLTLTNRLN